MKRREFIKLFGGAWVAYPFAARAQQGMPVIGLLNSTMPDALPYRLLVFRQGLHETGYVEGHNVVIEYHWAEGRNDRLQALVADLVRHRVAVIAAMSVPIVFTDSNDPVKHGLVASGTWRRP